MGRDDRARFLGRTGGYSHWPTVDPIEAVRPDEQERMSRAAHKRWEQTTANRWGEAAAEINRALDNFVAPEHVHRDRELMRGVRAVRRAAAAVERRLA